MKPGTLIKLPDGREGRVVYHYFDGYGIRFGRDPVDPDDLPPPQAMLRDPYPGAAVECVGTDYEVISEVDGIAQEVADLRSEVKREIEHLRQQLLAIAKRYAAECRLCGGCGVRRRLDVDGVPLDDVACEQCADVRLVIARAEGRSDG